MTNEAKNNQENDFEDLFEDDVFADTEKGAKEEDLANNGEGEISSSASGVSSNSDMNKYLIYGVGGVVVIGLCWALYRQFVPATPKVVHKVGPTRVLRTYNHTAKPTLKPKTQKVEDGILLNKKNLKEMITGFTKSTSDSLGKTQKQLNSRIDTMQSSFNSTYQNTQKEFAQVDQQLSLLAHQQINLAKMQKQQQLKEVGSFGSMLKDQNTKMIALTNKIDKLSVQFSKMNKTLGNVNQSIVKTQVQLKLIIAEKAAQAQKMTLRAVVAGRAWLVNGKGQTLTITVGSELPYYGKVLKIDSKANTVTMSTGYVFS